jgi:hypothetical protein
VAGAGAVVEEWEPIEGLLFALYSVSKEFCKAVSEGEGEEGGGVLALMSLLKSLVSLMGVAGGAAGQGRGGGGGGGVGGVHGRMLETIVWLIGSLAPLLVTPPTHTPAQTHTHTHTPPSDAALVCALELTYMALDSGVYLLPFFFIYVFFLRIWRWIPVCTYCLFFFAFWDAPRRRLR